MGPNPRNLVWARKKARLSRREAARSLGFNDTSLWTADGRLKAIEDGSIEPSQSVLFRMEKKYRVPLLAFYVSELPKDSSRDEVYRTLLGASTARDDRDLEELIERVKLKQDVARDLLRDEDFEGLDYISSATIDQSPKTISSRITSRLDFSLELYRKFSAPRDALSYIRERFESAGIFVLMMSDLGSYHSSIPVKIFRAFALVDRIAPFVVLNNRDAATAQSFSAFHEVVHLWIDGSKTAHIPNNRIESYANDVAGETLFPRQEIDRLSNSEITRITRDANSIGQFSAKRNLSKQMVAYRLFRAERIDKSKWQDINAETQLDDPQFTRRKYSGTGGPSYYVVQRYKLGNALLGLAQRSIANRSLTYSRAACLLGVRARSVKPLLDTWSC